MEKILAIIGSIAAVFVGFKIFALSRVEAKAKRLLRAKEIADQKEEITDAIDVTDLSDLVDHNNERNKS
jgi:hypothetical protein